MEGFAVRPEKEEKWITHYSSSHKILLVGEGDFSFSACLAEAFGSAANMVATSLDSKEELIRKYSKAAENLSKLGSLGCTLLHDIDCHTMSQHALVNHKLFHRIVFNFPHAGFICHEHCDYQIECHKKLVKGFLRSAHGMLTQNGEIHITHKIPYPYSCWEIQKLGEQVGLCLAAEVPFSRQHYPGYVNKRGDGYKCNVTFPVGESSTFKFCLPDI